MISLLLVWSALVIHFPESSSTLLTSPASSSTTSRCASQIARFSSRVLSATHRQIDSRDVLDVMGIERPLEVTELKTQVAPVGKAPLRFTEEELFTDGPSDLIIGIDVTGATEGHMYVGIRGPDGKSYRFDGRLFFNAHDISNAPWRLSDGLIIRFKNIPEGHRRVLADFAHWSQDKERDLAIHAPTCVAAACRLLYDIAGFEGDPTRAMPWFPKSFLRHLAVHGLKTYDGVRLIPEIYSLNRVAEDFWNRLPTWKRALFFIGPVIFKRSTWGLRHFEN